MDWQPPLLLWLIYYAVKHCAGDPRRRPERRPGSCGRARHAGGVGALADEGGCMSAISRNGPTCSDGLRLDWGGGGGSRGRSADGTASDSTPSTGLGWNAGSGSRCARAMLLDNFLVITHHTNPPCRDLVRLSAPYALPCMPCMPWLQCHLALHDRYGFRDLRRHTH